MVHGLSSAEHPQFLITRAAPDQAHELQTFLLRAKIGSTAGLVANGFWVATRQNRIVGCAALETVNPHGIIHSVAVEKDCRREGIGTKLLMKCLEQARRQRMQIVALTTMFWNIRFFKWVGFQTTSRKELPLPLKHHTDFCSFRFRHTTPMILILRTIKTLRQRRPR
jgi:N-acetylglutamate synthase-like GNAT family acetyltransferase